MKSRIRCCFSVGAITQLPYKRMVCSATAKASDDLSASRYPSAESFFPHKALLTTRFRQFAPLSPLCRSLMRPLPMLLGWLLCARFHQGLHVQIRCSVITACGDHPPASWPCRSLEGGHRRTASGKQVASPPNRRDCGHPSAVDIPGFCPGCPNPFGKG